MVGRRGQLSLEFSVLILVMLILSLATIYHFLDNNLDRKDRDLDKIDIGAKTAVSLVNSGYNGIYLEYPVIYLGMTYSPDKTYITLYIKNQSPLDKSTLELIEDLTYERADVNQSIYRITVVTVD
ncbi:MAG TPA: class III signal peptide-containing protein [Methanothermococcus okinawensis]|uniref:Class III signal peptide-containing protein n=1 Tax=Methanothermococcus okinawensis TaxID=155863 RepID=A0A832ZAM8_9EURY|nr:class III signal peptide-containing protein [Methanococcaceae archaeon]HIP84073.1 class III signal peptide-containing protein [Methanothermococcus okinawensis]HIP91620.1 class III signal peptide-containing protein [Methanothermococcus okinawensis]